MSRWLVLIIIILGLAVRFYDYPAWQGFDYDQEINAWIAKSIVVDHKPVLIGPETSVGAMYVGPYFNYIIAFFFALGDMDPAATIFLNFFLSLVTLVVFYLVAKNLFDQKAAIIGLIFYAFSYMISGYDQVLWNPTPIPLVSLLFFHFLYRNKVILAALFLGLMFHLHFQAILLAAIFVIYLAIFSRKEMVKPKNVLGTIAMMIIFFAPLIFFDLRHDFLNFRHLVQFFFEGSGKTGGIDLAKLWQTVNVLTSSFRDLVYNGSYEWVRVLVLILPMGTFLHLARNLKNNFYKLFSLTLLIAFLAFAFYKGPLPTQYYFFFLYPLFLLALSDWLAKRPMFLVIPFLAVFIIWNVIQTLTYFSSDLSLDNKHKAVKFISQKADDKTFKVDVIADLGLNTGFKYLFWLEEQFPSFDYTAKTEKSFKIVMPKTIARPDELTASFGAVGVVELP